jgi:hypothetical protein
MCCISVFARYGAVRGLNGGFWEKECFLRPKKGTDLQKNTEFIILLYLCNAQYG